MQEAKIKTIVSFYFKKITDTHTHTHTHTKKIKKKQKRTQIGKCFLFVTAHNYESKSNFCKQTKKKTKSIDVTLNSSISID